MGNNLNIKYFYIQFNFKFYILLFSFKKIFQKKPEYLRKNRIDNPSINRVFL